MSDIEKVLCINRSRLPESWVQTVSIVSMDLDSFISQCAESGFEFVIRKEAETDPSRKQIIPYILLQTSDGEYTAVYNRQGSEERLHDLWSVGIGGHINPVDTNGKTDSFRQILESGMARELEEELFRRPKEDRPYFAGIISEEKTEVGKVHLGAVFRIHTTCRDNYIPGPELFDFKWKKTRELENLRMEYWSELALKLVSGC